MLLPVIPAIFAVLACSPAPPVEVRQVLSDNISTVVLVDILDDLTDIESARVEYGMDGSFDRSLDFDLSGDEHARATLLGLKPETDISLRVVVVENGKERSSEDQIITTGSVPSWLPSLSVEVDDGQPHLDGGYLLTSIVTAPSAAVILDGDGEYVWWAELEGAHQVARVRLSNDGLGVYALPINIDSDARRGLIFTPWAGGQQTDTDVLGAHHDFVELADGTLGLLQEELRHVGSTTLIGDMIVEQGLDGVQTPIWNAFDDIDPALTPSGLEGGDWSHANVLVYDSEQDDWLVSLFGVRGIVRVDRSTARMVSILGSSVGDFTNSYGQTDFIHRQHVFQLLDGGILYFENSMPEEASSRAVELSLNQDQMTAEEVWSYTPDPELYTFSLGGVERLDSGDTLVTFSVNGRIDEVASDGSLRWRISSALGGTFGFSEAISLPGGG